MSTPHPKTAPASPDFTRIGDDLTYNYDGVFDRDAVQRAVDVRAADVRAADVIVTMGCGDACPVLPGKCYEDWDVADPTGQPIEAVRAIRDDIQARVTTLLGEILHQA